METLSVASVVESKASPSSPTDADEEVAAIPCSVCAKRPGNIAVGSGPFLKDDAPRPDNLEFYTSGVISKLVCPRCFLGARLATCGVCGIRYENGPLFYHCISCDIAVCSKACLTITGRDTHDCICNDCFDGLCEMCGNNVIDMDDEDCLYWDGEPLPYCEECRSISDSEEGSTDDEEEDDEEEEREAEDGEEKEEKAGSKPGDTAKSPSPNANAPAAKLVPKDRPTSPALTIPPGFLQTIFPAITPEQLAAMVANMSSGATKASVPKSVTGFTVVDESDEDDEDDDDDEDFVMAEGTDDDDDDEFSDDDTPDTKGSAVKDRKPARNRFQM